MQKKVSSVTKGFLLLGSINMCFVVAFGAFGAHGLRYRIPSEMMTIYHTAVQYHFYHAIGLLIVSFILRIKPYSSPIRWSGWLMVVGILLFSGSLYVLAITGIQWLGMITPAGGIAFLVAWVLLAIGVVKSP